MKKTPHTKNRIQAIAAKQIDFDEPAVNGNGRNGTDKPSGVKNRQAAAIRETEVLGSVAGLNLDSATNNIAATQVEVQKALADLSAKMVEQLQVLRNVEDAINLKRDELKQLYDIEAGAIGLDELDAKIAAQRELWEEEQARKKREFAEMQTERDKQWQRSEEEYEYQLAQEHKKSEDAFVAKLEERVKANRDKQEQLEKNWAEREGELKKRELELEALRAQVAGHPEVVKKEVNAAVAVATNSVKKEYETKIVLAAKDTETAQKLAAQEIASMKQALDKANVQMTEFRTQLEQAHRDMKEISAKALESASGRSAMEALQKVLEKDQNTKPGK